MDIEEVSKGLDEYFNSITKEQFEKDMLEAGFEIVDKKPSKPLEQMGNEELLTHLISAVSELHYLNDWDDEEYEKQKKVIKEAEDFILKKLNKKKGNE